MKTKTSKIFTLLLCLVLFNHGCAGPTSSPAIISPTDTPQPEPVSTEDPLPDDEILISVSRSAFDGMDEISACLAALNTYRFVLYGNGHLIRYDQGQYWETHINQPEIDELLSDIEMTGFSSLNGNGDQYIQNAPPPSFTDTWGGSVTVKDRTITVTPGQSDHLVEPVTSTLDLIEQYQPGDLQLYDPESAVLWVFLEQNLILGTANPTPEAPDLHWTVEEIDLVKARLQPISGEALAFVMNELEHIPALRRVEQNGETYLVILCPNFP